MPRNASGTYTLPSGNPVISGTVIASDWANTTMPDLGNEITDSLSRSGEGGMLAPLKHTDGTAAAPAVTWTNEITSGWYRFGAGEIRFSLLTNDVITVTNSQVQVMNTVTGGGLERVLTESDIGGAVVSALTFGGVERVNIDNADSVNMRAPAGASSNAFIFWDNAGSPMGAVGFNTMEHAGFTNSKDGGLFQLLLKPTGLGPEFFIEADPDSGHVKLYNTVTGTGLERALTESDLAGAGTPPSYNFSSAVVTAPDANGVYALAIGDSAQAQSDDAIAIGTAAESFSPSSVAVGPGAYAPAPNTLALGHDASAGASGTVAVGFDAGCTGNDSVAIGTNATSGAGNAVTIGLNSASNAPDNVTIGNGATSNGPDCVSLGTGTVASGQGIVAVGEGVSVVANDGISIGPHSSVASLQSIAIGSGASAPIGDYSVAIGPAAEVSDASAIVIKAGSVAAASPGANSITLATSATNSVEYYQGKFRLNNASAQIIVPEHADATALSGEAGSFVFETAEGLRFYDGSSWQTLLTQAGSSGVVTLSGAQTITGEKTFTAPQKFQYADDNAIAAIRIGADALATTVTDGATKRASVAAPHAESATENDVCIFGVENFPTNSYLDIGHTPYSTTLRAPTRIRLAVSKTALVAPQYIAEVHFNHIDLHRPLRLPVASAFTLNNVDPTEFATLEGAVAYCTNGDSGAPCLAVSDGTNWLRVPLGAPIIGA